MTKTVDPFSGETTFTYDGNGNVLTLTDARNKTTTWTYDNRDRVATRTDPLTRQESFDYDENGNLSAFTDRKGQVRTHEHDALDRQTFVGFGTTGTPPAYASTITTITMPLVAQQTSSIRVRGRSSTHMTCWTV